MSDADGPAKDIKPATHVSRADSNALPTLDADATLDTSGLASPAPSAVSGESLTTAKPIFVGPYRLVRKLGEGGMGQVWLAEQTAPVRRQVALKLIKVGMYDDAVLKRFQSERQSLAIMDHPSIAKVFDAGATPDGQPYFVMEYVPGSPITAYCDQKRLKIRERLELFIKVCEGVQHAHQKAVIHRDLKPANVLVVEVDGKAMPRIIDFGLAKATGPQLAAENIFTQVGSFVGTPGYMSPEQADSSVQDIDTRTDVYSLGVVLYVLLTGAVAFRSQGLEKKPSTKWSGSSRDEDAPRPSTKVGLNQESSIAGAEARGVHPKQLANLLEGDLDWIAMKALERDRELRYNSPFELAADLNRWLKDEPVIARPPSPAYRTSKFVRRHRLGVGFAVSIASLLVAFAAMMGRQTIRVQRERDRANQNAEVADKNRIEATKQAQLALDTIYQVVTNTDEKLQPIPGTGPLREELLRAAMKNLDSISRTAATSSWADRTMGVALQRMAEFSGQMNKIEQQAEILERSLQIFDRLMNEDPNQDWTAFDAAISYDGLGEIGRELEPDPSKIYLNYEKSLEIRQRLVAEVHQDQPSIDQRKRALATSHIKLAALALELHDPTKALNHAQNALSVVQTLNPKLNGYREVLSEVYRNLGLARLLVGQGAMARDAYHQAEELQREWAEEEPLSTIARRDHGRTNLAVGDLELDFGNVDASLQQYRNAEAIFAVLIEKDATDLEYRWFLANTQYEFGRALQTAGRRDEADLYFRDCLANRIALFRGDPKNTQLQIDLMLVNAQLGRYQDAVADARVVEQHAPHNPGKLFSASCAYGLSISVPGITSRQRDRFADDAIRVLRMAFVSGFRDPWTLQHAPELQNVRSYNAYKQLLNEVSDTVAASGMKLR